MLGALYNDAAMDEAIVSAARDQAGPDCEIMVDAGGSDAYWPHGYKWALQTATMLHKYDVAWFEEALRPDDIEGYAKLTEHAPLPISSCEVSCLKSPILTVLFVSVLHEIVI